MGNCKTKTDTKSESSMTDSENKQNTQTPERFDRQRIINLLKDPNSTQASATYNPMSNATTIDSTRKEVSRILGIVDQFVGTNESDKNYRYLDEMLTRCILNLDQIDCNSQEERDQRKGAILEVNSAISILERKLAMNHDMQKLDQELNHNR